MQKTKTKQKKNPAIGAQSTVTRHHQALQLQKQQLRDCTMHRQHPQPDPYCTLTALHGTSASRGTKQSPTKTGQAACQNSLKKKKKKKRKRKKTHTSLENSFIQIFLNIESVNKSTTWLGMQVPFASFLTVPPAHTWTQHLLPERNSGNSQDSKCYLKTKFDNQKHWANSE